MNYIETTHEELMQQNDMLPVKFIGVVTRKVNTNYDVAIGSDIVVVSVVDGRTQQCRALDAIGSTVRVFAKRCGEFRSNPACAFVLADSVTAILNSDDSAPARKPAVANYERLGFGSIEELLYFKMKYSANAGYALIPQYRVAVGSKNYRVDFAMIDLRTEEIVGLIEIDGKQHERTVDEDLVRAHEIEQITGMKISRIFAETVRAMAKERGLL